MALDKLVDSTQLDADLTSVANAIRTKGGTSASLAFPADFVDAIDAIETGGGGGGIVIEDELDTHGGTVRTITAVEISGTKQISANGTGIDVTGYAAVDVDVPPKAVQIASGVGRVASTTYASTGVSLTVAKSGTYSVYWVGYRSSTSGSNGTRLYVDGSAHTSGEQTTFDGTYANVQNVHLSSVSLTKDHVLTVYAKSRGTSYQMYAMDLVIIEE